MRKNGWLMGFSMKSSVSCDAMKRKVSNAKTDFFELEGCFSVSQFIWIKFPLKHSQLNKIFLIDLKLRWEELKNLIVLSSYKKISILKLQFFTWGVFLGQLKSLLESAKKSDLP
jgi:hypothetical protein